MELTPDEVRLIQDQRALQAAKERPPPGAALLVRCTMQAIRALVKQGQMIDPVDPVWQKLAKITEGWPKC